MVNRRKPTYSVGGFFHWFGQVLWKYIRPILWNLLILVHRPFFYIRSTIRYAVVTPLAILRRGPELTAQLGHHRG